MDNNGSVLDIFQNLVGNLEAAVEDLASEKSDDNNENEQAQAPANVPQAGPASSDPKAAPESIVEGGSKRTSKSPQDSDIIDSDLDIIDIDDDSEDEPVQKTEAPAAAPASASASASSGSASLSSSLKDRVESAEKSKESSPRSRKKYVPPGRRSSRTSPRDGGDSSLGSGMGSLSRETPSWQRYDRDELDKRKKCLVGQTVVGKLSPKRGNRYFIKWNVEPYDTIVISADKVEEVLGASPPAGMWVSATIVGIGPSHVSWKKQHPYAMTLESRETRPSHQPSRGAMPPNAPYWKKTQRAGIVREVEDEVEVYRTVPADFGMSRAKRSSGSRPGSANTSPNGSYRSSYPQRSAVVPPFPPQRRSARNHGSYTGGSAVITADDVIAEMQDEANKPKIYDLKVTQGANVNLVTGKIRQMGRSEAHRSWRRGGGDPRDRGFTV